MALEDVATQTAVALKADKLVFFMETEGVAGARGKVVSTLTVAEGDQLLKKQRKLAEDVGFFLPAALAACNGGVKRAHLISRHRDGALLAELFTREGVGTLITPTPLEMLRRATIGDVGGVLQLIEPLEQAGILVRRSRELLEMEIERFMVLVSDGVIAGCIALYPFIAEQTGELACLAVAPDYRRRGYGEQLLQAGEAQARRLGLQRIFVLTTRTEHWFEERGFVEKNLGALPKRRQALYNYQRRSKVLEKILA